LAFILIFAPLGYFMDIKDGLKSARKPIEERPYKDNSAIYDMRAAIIAIIGALLFVIWAN
jgi:hypothetical protein